LFGGYIWWFSWSILATQWIFLAPTTCSIQFGSPSVGDTWFHILHLLGAMVNFDEVDPFHELDIDPEIDIEQEVVFDQKFTSYVALTYLVDHVPAPDRLALIAFLLCTVLPTLMTSGHLQI
jgi:hypothetical protein